MENKLIDQHEIRLLDYLFLDGLYPIDEDRDYAELGAIFHEDGGGDEEKFLPAGFHIQHNISFLTL